MSTERTIDLFGLGRHSCAYLIGGGGKTSLMFALASAISNSGKSVVTTTSTKILQPGCAESPCVLAGAWEEIRDELKDRLRLAKHVTIARRAEESHQGKKLCGYTADELEVITSSLAANYFIVEADGSAGRSLKTHREFEPVLPVKPGLVIAVIGIDCLGKPIDPLYVHRSELFAQRLRRPEGTLVTSDEVASIIFHADGYLSKVPPDTEVIVFLSKVSSQQDKQDACRLAERLKDRDPAHRLSAIIRGEVRDGKIRLSSDNLTYP